MQKQTQSLQQKQTLTMTASMHRSISILQMSNIELSEFAMRELSKNPFIEDARIITENSNKPSVIKEKFFQSYGNNFSGNSNGSNQDFFLNIPREKSLKEHITEQIDLAFDDSKEKLIGFFLLDSLQNSGYLKITTLEAASILKCEEALVEKVLKTLQTFDPSGVFARNLQECLLIQLQDQPSIDPALLTMVQNINLIAEGNFKKLSKLCKVTIGDLSTMVKQIRLLNPKPTNGFFVEQTSYKIPDVFLTFNEQGTVRLETNYDSIPQLKINEEYYNLVKNNVADPNEKKFVKAEIESANTIIKSIDHRNSTILRIAEAIVKEQIDFFTKGVMYLKPLTLNAIAATTGLNESTVSRSTSNKYISTPGGIYELKYFFSSSLSTSRTFDENVSSTKVKEIIKQIIMSEDPSNILSDDDLTEELSKFNIKIARRTVAKYRESLGIPTSSLRKRNVNIQNL